ncbi:MAG: hypothetical protein A4E48_01715 [Methanosaeta sp. PtaU1.Bin060]|nr:MAG: hypothetical protein A4E48_01715 [Methanosaeta sp. PtaU1.Bin060]
MNSKKIGSRFRWPVFGFKWVLVMIPKNWQIPPRIYKPFIRLLPKSEVIRNPPQSRKSKSLILTSLKLLETSFKNLTELFVKQK